MAADSREFVSPPATQPPPEPSDPTQRPYRGKIYETFLPPTTAPPSTPNSPLSPSNPTTPTHPSSPYTPRAPENANAIPGGSTNTPGGRVKEASLLDGLRSIRVQDFQELHQKPCVRDAFLVGIGAGFALGGGRMVFGASAWKSMSLAIGTFGLSSAGSYEFCQRRRALERQGMLRAAEIIDRKKVERERERERVRAERRRRREEEERVREEERKREEEGRREEEGGRGRGWRFWGG